MLLHTRAADVGLHTGAVTREIARTSRLVSRLTGYPVQPNKAIVGRNAFAHESGIHQDGVLKERTTYEIMDATTVGLEANSIVLGKHSGRHALQQALAELGFEVSGQALNTAFKRFKEIADKKKQVTAMDLEALVTDELREEIARLPARVVRRRGLVAPAAARDRRRAHARRARSWSARSPATAPSTRSSTRSTRRPASMRGCASSGSTRSPAARTRSARRRSCSRSAASSGVRPGRLDRHPRGGRPRLRARAVQRRAAAQRRGPRPRRRPPRRPTASSGAVAEPKYLRQPGALARPLHGGPCRALGEVIVDESARLHQRVQGRRAHEPESAPLELAGERDGLAASSTARRSNPKAGPARPPARGLGSRSRAARRRAAARRSRGRWRSSPRSLRGCG